jgi:hypothetical protein
MNTTATTFTTLDGQEATLIAEGEGNWTAETPAGEFEIVMTSADTRVNDDDSLAVFGPNHHYPDAWFDSFPEVIAYLRRQGADARTTRHIAA